ncbi:uncharacterized protein LOC111269459 isoform X1 [Varroa jacobsoni]|uniref:uncharacterized protein LOC111269459 isoform X1 n=1 Tax=Varroa jacobsoni TaxID=62625 RepID=UPI000BF877A1|nr:uncharacterized protein LOC111269459 isoform X1 [Varroa jacobsoni]
MKGKSDMAAAGAAAAAAATWPTNQLCLLQTRTTGGAMAPSNDVALATERTDRQTDRQTDRRTDGRTDGRKEGTNKDVAAINMDKVSPRTAEKECGQGVAEQVERVNCV